MSSAIQWRLHGTRGTAPVSGAAYRRFGGHTTCFSLELPDRWIVVDAGSGLAGFAAAYGNRDERPVSLLLTHLHLDHVVGFAGLPLRLRAGHEIDVYASNACCAGWQEGLARLLRPPFWPVPLENSASPVSLHDLPPTGSRALGGVTLSWRPIPHPQGCLAYRFDAGTTRIVVATDVEHDGAPAPDFLAFCKDATLLVHDAQYIPEEQTRRRGYGHCTWAEAADVAQRAGATELVLTHHDPLRTDDALAAMEAAARERFPNTRAGAEETTWEFPA